MQINVVGSSTVAALTANGVANFNDRVVTDLIQSFNRLVVYPAAELRLRPGPPAHHRPLDLSIFPPLLAFLWLPQGLMLFPCVCFARTRTRTQTTLVEVQV